LVCGLLQSPKFELEPGRTHVWGKIAISAEFPPSWSFHTFENHLAQPGAVPLIQWELRERPKQISLDIPRTKEIRIRLQKGDNRFDHPLVSLFQTVISTS
jgi:hypothetical protein